MVMSFYGLYWDASRRLYRFGLRTRFKSAIARACLANLETSIRIEERAKAGVLHEALMDIVLNPSRAKEIAKRALADYERA
jgi:hypothetical protein